MKEIFLPIERLNKFLSEHTFNIKDPLGSIAPSGLFADVKVQITGTKEMIRTGDLTTFIKYTLIIQDGSPMVKSLVGLLMRDQKELVLTNTDITFYVLISRLNEQLENFLLYWDVNNPVMCVKVINETNREINESIQMGNEFNDVTKILVDDILRVFKNETQGTFTLPEYFDEEEMVYIRPIIDGYVITLEIVKSEDVVDFEVDGDLYYDDDEIYIIITANPNMSKESMDDLIGELIETVRHEIEHIIQIDNGEMPTKEPKEPEDYYTQNKELDAQRAGFKMRSQEKNTDFETLVRQWFKKYPHKHRLTSDQEERVIQKVLSEK
jgi:hypothetical protein